MDINAPRVKARQERVLDGTNTGHVQQWCNPGACACGQSEVVVCWQAIDDGDMGEIREMGSFDSSGEIL
jgi:hypothetical protein